MLRVFRLNRVSFADGLANMYACTRNPFGGIY